MQLWREVARKSHCCLFSFCPAAVPVLRVTLHKYNRVLWSAGSSRDHPFHLYHLNMSTASVKVLQVRPDVKVDKAIKYAEDLYGFQLAKNCIAKELCSYDDRNFYLKGRINGAEEEKKFVLKFMNSLSSYNPEFLDAMDQAMMHFNKCSQDIKCPVPIASLTGKLRHKIELPIADPFKAFEHSSPEIDVNDPDQVRLFAESDPLVKRKEKEDGSVLYYIDHYVRLLTFVEGKTLGELEVVPDQLLFECGALVAKVQSIFKNFYHPSLTERKHMWNTMCAGNLSSLIDELKCLDHSDIELLRQVLTDFDSSVLPKLNSYPWQTMHADLNCDNIVFEDAGPDGIVLSGIIDFGDMIYGCYLFEIGIALAYVGCIDRSAPLNSMKSVLKGYQSVYNLSDVDLNFIIQIVFARLAQSVVIGCYSEKLGNMSEYVLKDVFRSLELLCTLKSFRHHEIIALIGS